MTRVNIDILGISELKWTGMGEFNSNNYYIYYCGQKFLRINGVALIVNERIWNAVLECNLKKDRIICLFPRLTIHYHSFRTNTQERCPFHHRGLECKSRKSRDIWMNRQIWPWSTKWSRERLTGFWQENTLVIANTLVQQHKRRYYTHTSSNGQYQNQIDYIFCSWRWRSSLQSAKTRLGDVCDSDHELLLAKFRLK